MSESEEDEGTPGGIGELARALRPYLRPYRGLAAVVFVGLLLEMAFMSSIPVCFKFLVDDLVADGIADWFYVILLGLSVAVIVVSSAGLGCDYLYAKLVSKVIGDVRARLFAHLQHLALEFFGRTKAGDTLNRFSGDIVTIETALSGAVAWAVLPSLDVIAATCILFTLDWRLALLALLVFPLTLLGPRFVVPKANAASYDRKLEEGRLLANVQENISAQPVVKAFNLVGKAAEQFTERNLVLMRKCMRLGFLDAMVERSAGVGIRLLQVAVLGVGVWMAWKKELSIGSLAAFQTLFTSLSSSLQYVTEYAPTLIQAGGAMRHIQDIFDEPDRVKDAPGAGELPKPRREIAFDQVHFSYTGTRTDLDGVSLRIPCGNNVAFVGPSGSGKSTMINLVMRFYDPSKGRVTVDGQDLTGVTQASLRRHTGIVFQESFLFNTTVRENLRLGKEGATDAEIEAAAKKAEIHDVILRLPNGYDTPVGERGGRLSGGQRQRIALARALVRDPPILVLDEATSALDPATEEAINQTLANLARGRTVLTVTHRLASVQNCDRVFVMEQGRLVEQGSHAELLQARGVYQQLWQKQTGFTLSADGERALIAPDKLLELPILAELPKDLREKAAGLFHTEQWAADRAIFHQGDIGDRLYVIVRGEAGVFYKKKGAEEARVAILEVGDFFGEIALLCNMPRTATVRTLSPCILLALHRGALLSLLEEAPDLRAKLQRVAEERLPMYRQQAVKACADVDIEWDIA